MRHVSKARNLAFAVSTAAIAIASACASNPPLHTEGSTSGIRAAEEVGANEVPRAALHLQLAKEELEHARRMAANGEDEQAASMLSRAEADAELAVALSREETERSEGQAAVQRVRDLRQENNAATQNNRPNDKEVL